MDFIADLQWRGLIKDVTDLEGLTKRLETGAKIYCGFDPTADSLHIGHLQQILLLLRYKQQGHQPIALIGGGTGMIGDPRETSERTLQSAQQVAYHSDCIKKQIEAIVGDEVEVLNNYDWLSKIDLLSFLRDYGKHFNVNTMIAKETIASRLASGISYTEFSYTILQAIDWLHLLEHHDVQIQVGGSDQWGNLVSGVDLIRKMKTGDKEVYGITSPLITKADGSKFGKSEGANVWLDANKTDPYTFYQFWINTGDDDVENFLKRLTLKSRAEIEAIMEKHRQNPELRYGQKELAAAVTLLVHKQQGLDSALKITEALFHDDVLNLSSDELRSAFKDATMVEIEHDGLLIDVLVEHGLIKSKREVRQLISQKGLQVNGEVVESFDVELCKEYALNQELSIIKKGKKTYYLIYHK